MVIALIIGAVAGVGSSSSPSDSASGADLPAITAAAPPSDAAAQAPCTKVLEGLPVQLDGLDPRQVVTTPSSPFVVGWGNPAVILRCGVAKPADVHVGSDALFQLISPAGGAPGVYFDVTSQGDANVYTSVDRVVYIEITVPAKYAAGPMPVLAGIIAKALPPVCNGDGSAPDADTLCTHRTS